MFFAVWKHAPIKTTLLRELEEVCDVTYREFEDPEELRGDLQHFLRRVAQGATSTPISPGTRQIWRWIPWTLIRDRCEATIWCPWVDRSHSVEPVLRRDPPLARRPLRNSQQF